jgi:hypothetical protein
MTADYPQTQSHAVPSVIIVSDHMAGTDLAREAIAATGCRLVAAVDLAAASSRLYDQISIDAVMFECASAAPATIMPLIDQINQMGARRQPAALISTSFDDVDHYSALMLAPHVTLMCAPDLSDRVVALQLATLRQGVVLNDSATDLESMRLQRLADEVGRIAKALSSLSGVGANPPAAQPGGTAFNDAPLRFRTGPTSADLGGGTDAAQTAPSANDLRNMIRVRRMRDQFFAGDLFADPAWDMLLDLLAARMERVQVAVSSLCIASAVPPTTALRWIKRMCDDGLFERVADPDDGRRIFIRLSDTAADAMARYWQSTHRYVARMV